ncbi:MAG: hypothetical protein Fur0014_12640 [Rubrivivax sp.]
MTALAVYGALLLAALAVYLGRRAWWARVHRQRLEAARAAGVAEPVSLHPVVDPGRCIGSAACTRACPEQALGIVDGKAMLLDASACIGHGACLAACPVDAIRLVFGTEQRGVDIPALTPQFETNVPGIFIAGELGGMGLIRKAAEQGRQAIDAVRLRERGVHDLDVVIVGCGPAGLSAGLAAKAAGLRYRLIEQEESLGGTVYHYPRQKIAMTAPVRLALVGTVRFSEVAKERLLEFWNGIVDRTGLEIHFREQLTGIAPAGDGFVVHTSRGQYRTRSVVLALGRRGTPRKLGVPGEESPHVVYRLVDPEQYRGRAVLVVGGGDSAVEAAVAVAAEPGTRVVLTYRGQGFARVKPRNREALDRAAAAGGIEVLLGTEVLSIGPRQVQLRGPRGEALERGADAVIVCAGGELPVPLLKAVGVHFETKFGTA